jgi:hypothetical protein
MTQFLNERFKRVAGRLFAEPVGSKGASSKGYLVTQFLASMMRWLEFDGLEFESAQHEGGVNYALFDPGAFRPNGQYWEAPVSSIKYEATYAYTGDSPGAGEVALAEALYDADGLAKKE